MRRALLFIMLINFITCVTENLAMEKENSEDDIELSDTERQASEKRVATSQKKKRKSRCREEAGGWCKVITTGALLLSLGVGPAIISMEGTKGMNNVASPITVYPAHKVIEKPDCTYSPYSSPEIRNYMKGECEKSEEGWYECIIEECEGAEQYKKSYQMAEAGYILSLLTGMGFSASTFLVVSYTCFLR